MNKLILFSIFCLLMFTGIFSAGAEYTHENREPTPLEKQTFTILKKRFPGEILDEKLRTLHELAESPEYLKFLDTAYPDAKPIPEFADIVDFNKPIHRILPPKERYLTFYAASFQVQTAEEVTDAEHFIVHYNVVDDWISYATERGADRPQYANSGELRLTIPINVIPRIVRTPIYREIMEARIGVPANQKMSAELMLPIIRHIEMPILSMTREHIAADTLWIKSLFEKHGYTDGCIWLALQDPIIFQKVRHAFTTDTTFLRFIYTNPAEAEAAEDAKYERKSRARHGERKKAEQ